MEKRPGIDIPWLQQAAPAAAAFLLRRRRRCHHRGSLRSLRIHLLEDATPAAPIAALGVSGRALAVFWAAYQYLLVTYSGTTPGLRLARLELTRFDGTPAGRRLRRWRVLASFLSAVSLGYAWAFLDESSVLGTTRITHTYLAPRVRHKNPTHSGELESQRHTFAIRIGHAFPDRPQLRSHKVGLAALPGQ